MAGPQKRHSLEAKISISSVFASDGAILFLRLLRHSQTHSAAEGALPLAQTLPLLS